VKRAWTIFAVAAAVGMAMPPAWADWPMIQKDPTHTGFVLAGPRAPLKRAWKATPGFSQSNFTTWPALYRGVVFARSGKGVFAVDAKTGRRKWLVQPPEGSTIVAPAVDAQGVYIPVPYGRILALNRETGEVLWRFQADNELESAPTLADGRLYFGSWEGKAFYCVDVATGALVWKVPLEWAVDSVPAVSQGFVVFSMQNPDRNPSAVIALDASSGKEVWRIPQVINVSSPSIMGDKVVFGGGDLAVYAVELQTGKLVWKARVPDAFSVRNSPAIAYGDVFMADRVGNFYRLDGNTGKRKWIFSDTEGTYEQSYPVVAGKTFFIGGDAGWVYALNADTGKLQWNEQVGGFVMSGAADAERFYFGVKFRNEGLYAYEHDPKGSLEPGSGSETPQTGREILTDALFALVLLGGLSLLLRILKRSRDEKASRAE
jgi:outer membrane protein assembly factor BamB